MTSAAIRLLKPRSHHLHSLAAFNKTLPEFSDASIKQNNIVDEAFKSSFIDEVSDGKYWKTLKQRFMQKTPTLTPRELSRLKFALSYQGRDAAKYANWGRSELHNRLTEQCIKQVQSMNTIELLSAMYGFRSLKREDLYESLLAALTKEIKNTKELDILAIAPYVVSHSAIHTRYLNLQREKTKTYERNFAFLEVIQNLVANRITEFSDDQLAALCAGLSNSEVHPEKLLKLKDMIDGIETDVLNRRIDRMSGTNLVDVAKCFSKLNWGSDQLFSGLQKYSKQHLNSLNIDEVVDLSYFLTCREELEKGLKEEAERKILAGIQQVRSDFLGKVALYLFMNLSANTELLKGVVQRVEAGPDLNLYRMHTFRVLRVFLDAKFPNLVTENYIKRLEANAVIYRIDGMAQNPRYKSAMFRTTSNVLANLGFRMVKSYCYEHMGILDFGAMPQKVGINLALPAYDLLGKYEPDDRLVKTSKRVFRPSKLFYSRGELFRLKGFKVLDWNAHDLSENMSATERREFILSSLAKEGVTPTRK